MNEALHHDGVVAPDRPLKVLWVAKGLDVGGVERLLSWMAIVHDRSAFDIELAFLPRWGTTLAGSIESAGVRMHPMPALHETDLRWAFRLRSLLRRRPFDIVHVQTPYVAWVSRLVARTLPRHRRPLTMSTEHNVWPDYLFLTRLANACTYPLDAAHLAVSERVRESIPMPLRAGVRSLVHGIPMEDARSAPAQRGEVRRDHGIGDATFVVGAIASLRPAKGYCDLLHAARQVLDRGLDVVFLAIGSGPQEAELRRLHRRLRLGDSFRFLGFRSDAVRQLAGCDAYVLASDHEGGPLAVLEAMAVGLPVVATDVGIVPEVVREGVDGFIVPIRSPTALATAICRLVEDPDLRARMGQAAAVRAPERSVVSTVRVVESLYREVASTRAQRSGDARPGRPAGLPESEAHPIGGTGRNEGVGG